jgi:hypothetical protein
MTSKRIPHNTDQTYADRSESAVTKKQVPKTKSVMKQPALIPPISKEQSKNPWGVFAYWLCYLKGKKGIQIHQV